MLSLSQKSGYAILALACMYYRKSEWMLTQEISEITGIPKPYLHKILHGLGQSGLIRTKRGYHGGMALARPAEEITLLDIIVATEGENWKNRCLLGLSHCSDERKCPVHSYWKKERNRIEDKLRRVTLAHAAEFERKAAWRKSQIEKIQIPAPPPTD